MKERHDHHHIFSIFIIFFSLLLLGVIGVFAYDVFFDGNARTVMRIELNEQVIDDGLVQNLDLINDSLPEQFSETATSEQELVQTAQVSGTPIRPGFAYPLEWHAFMESVNDQTDLIYRVSLNTIPITSSEGAIITIETFSVPQESVDTISWSENFIEGIDNATVQIIPEENDENSSYLLQSSGEVNTSYLVYDNGVTGVVATFTDINPTQFDNDAWKTVLDSITFASLQ